MEPATCYTHVDRETMTEQTPIDVCGIPPVQSCVLSCDNLHYSCRQDPSRAAFTTAKLGFRLGKGQCSNGV